ncbi:MAG: hypothetical protein JZU65_20015 [Chlorobium sp.]|nr:hypothetical protein [Chlorobium sp.]
MSDIKNIHTINVSERLAAISVIVLIFAMIPAIPLHKLLDIDIKNVYRLSTVCLIFFLILKNVHFRISLHDTVKVLPFIILTSSASLFSNSTSQLLLGIVLIVMVSLSKPVVRLALNQDSMKYLYYFAVVLLAGAWIGFFYAMTVGVPQICVDNPNGRPNCLYLTTFSNSDSLDFWRIIRPSGIFDEPGALSFFTILVVCLNELSEGGKIKSFILLCLGLITLSFAHILCSVAYTAIMFKKKMVYVLLIFVLAVGSAQFYVPDESILYMNFISRLAISKEEGLKGDNRSGQVKEFFSLLNYDISRYGDNVMVNQRGGVSEAYDQSSNPFSIWFGYGFIMWLPYVITLLVLLYHFFNRIQSVQVTSVLMFMLLLQRPYIYSMEWGFAIWVVITAMFYKKRESNKYRNNVRGKEEQGTNTMVHPIQLDNI